MGLEVFFEVFPVLKLTDAQCKERALIQDANSHGLSQTSYPLSLIRAFIKSELTDIVKMLQMKKHSGNISVPFPLHFVSSIFIRVFFFLFCFFCVILTLISASGGLCFMIVTFPSIPKFILCSLV